MNSRDGASGAPAGSRISAAQVIVVSSVMFTFISCWRTAAVVLCDLGSTAFYIGGIAEQSIGPAAPWFILAVMVFSGAVSLVYIESSAMFVRGGVYRVVKEAMGGALAKVSVSALMFDYVLTGPISGVSAGQYIVSLILDLWGYAAGEQFNPATKDAIKGWGAVIIAVAITLYFFRQNLRGIHESSEKALKIMGVVTVMGVVMLAWCGLTLWLEGPRNPLPSITPDLVARPDPGGHMIDPLGFLAGTGAGEALRQQSGTPWWSIIGLVGICLAFGHSVLAMSGLETLAQVYREVESPKLPNFKKAALIVFLYSVVLTGTISFLAVLLIPDSVRMSQYADNLIGGLAMNVVGPMGARLLLNAFVVVVGFLVLAGAVNTAIIGSNGVLNRVAEDGVVPTWFLKPHPRYGTTYRMLLMILIMQLVVIVGSRGDVLLLGEAYAFGVIWSFVFKTLSMLVLRVTDRATREFKVPGNLRIGRWEIPWGLTLIFVILLIAAILNLLTKTTATTWGLVFTAVFLAVFSITERVNHRRRRGEKHQHVEQFNRELTPALTREALGLERAYRKLVTIRSPNSMYMLERALAETDPETTDVVVMTAKLLPTDQSAQPVDLDDYDQALMTAVVNRAEHAGKSVIPLIVPTNNPLHAIMQTVDRLGVGELILGASNKFTAEEQLDQAALYWISMHTGEQPPLTIRILSRYWDVSLDLGGGNRIPKISERRARSISELRAAGVGVSRMLLTHDGTPAHHDLFQVVLTTVDPQVTLDVVAIPSADQAPPPEPIPSDGACADVIRQGDLDRARSLGREVGYHQFGDCWGRQLVALADEGRYDLIILGLPHQSPERDAPWDDQTEHVLQHAHCQVVLAPKIAIPTQVAD